MAGWIPKRMHNVAAVDYELENNWRWREAESLATLIMAAADSGLRWHELRPSLGPRPPDVVERAFNIAFYEEMLRRREEKEEAGSTNPNQQA